MKKSIVAAALMGLAISPALAQQERVEVGLLDCQIEGGTGFVFGSTKQLACTFQPAGEGRLPESYVGVIRKFGLDVGVTGQQVMQWAVLAPTNDDYAPGALAGTYVGASAEATAGVGVGANILLGGSNETFMLQPVSVQAQTGVNLALGVAELELSATAD
jgi:hypothetical protein